MIRGEIWWVDFGTPLGSEPGFRRPSIIVQSDAFNQTSMHTTMAVHLKDWHFLWKVVSPQNWVMV